MPSCGLSAPVPCIPVPGPAPCPGGCSPERRRATRRWPLSPCPFVPGVLGGSLAGQRVLGLSASRVNRCPRLALHLHADEVGALAQQRVTEVGVNALHGVSRCVLGDELVGDTHGDSAPWSVSSCPPVYTPCPGWCQAPTKEGASRPPPCPARPRQRARTPSPPPPPPRRAGQPPR